MVARLLAMPGVDRETFAGIRMLAYAGAPMPPEQMRQAYDRLTPNLVQYYGLVEAIPPVTVLDADDHARGLTDEPELLGSAGRPALGVEIAVVDDDGRTVPAGEVGEVITRGDHVMAGYWNADGRARIWPRACGTAGCTPVISVGSSGDGLLARRPQGRHDHLRRLQHLPARGRGRRRRGAGRRRRSRCSACPTPTGDSGCRRSTDGRPATPSTSNAIMEHCRARLSSYKKPKELQRVDAFPLNSTGKIAKKVLRAHSDGAAVSDHA